MTSRLRGCARVLGGVVVLRSAPLLAQSPELAVTNPPGERPSTRGDAAITILRVERPPELTDFVILWRAEAVVNLDQVFATQTNTVMISGSAAIRHLEFPDTVIDVSDQQPPRTP